MAPTRKSKKLLAKAKAKAKVKAKAKAKAKAKMSKKRKKMKATVKAKAKKKAKLRAKAKRKAKKARKPKRVTQTQKQTVIVKVNDKKPKRRAPARRPALPKPAPTATANVVLNLTELRKEQARPFRQTVIPPRGAAVPNPAEGMAQNQQELNNFLADDIATLDQMVRLFKQSRATNALEAAERVALGRNIIFMAERLLRSVRNTDANMANKLNMALKLIRNEVSSARDDLAIFQRRQESGDRTGRTRDGLAGDEGAAAAIAGLAEPAARIPVADPEALRQREDFAESSAEAARREMQRRIDAVESPPPPIPTSPPPFAEAASLEPTTLTAAVDDPESPPPRASALPADVTTPLKKVAKEKKKLEIEEEVAFKPKKGKRSIKPSKKMRETTGEITASALLGRRAEMKSPEEKPAEKLKVKSGRARSGLLPTEFLSRRSGLKPAQERVLAPEPLAPRTPSKEQEMFSSIEAEIMKRRKILSEKIDEEEEQDFE